MKKLLFSLLVCISTLTSFAQVHYDGPWSTGAQGTCFCCDPNFSLPTNPPIYTNFIHGIGTSPDTLSCKGTNSLFTLECSSAKYNWTVSPALTFNGQGTSKIDLVSASVAGTTYTICVTITCGNKSVKACKQVYSKECCDCSGLPQSFNITGPQFYCISTPCNQTFTYTAPNFGVKPCFSYDWVVKNPNGGTVTIGGQGANTIEFPCTAITIPGSYTISLTIKCGTKTVTSTITLIACAKPDPLFTASIVTASTVTLSTTLAGCTNYWYLVKDNDNSDDYTSGDIILAPSPLTTNPATFTGLVAGQHYIAYHFAVCNCGPNGKACWSWTNLPFSPQPPHLQKAIGGKKGEIMSQKSMDNQLVIPQEFKKTLPKLDLPND
jgi:hypothetical protein